MSRRLNQSGYSGPNLQIQPMANPIGGGAGTGLDAVGGIFNRLMSRAADRADRQAVSSAALQGQINGASGNFQAMDEGTLVGEAYNATARDTFTKRLELDARTQIDTLSSQHQADPEALKTALDTYATQVQDGLDDDAVKAGFGQLFAPVAARAIAVATVNKRKVIDDQNRVAVIEANTARVKSHSQYMRAAGGGDAAALALARGERAAVVADLLANGPQTEFEYGSDPKTGAPMKHKPGSGAFSVAQIHDQIAKLDAEGTEQGILGWWENGPKTQERADKWLAAPTAGVSQDQKDRLNRYMLADVKEVDYRKAKAERDAEKADNEARAGFKSDFEIALNRGQKTYRDIEEAYAAGKLKPSERADYTIALDKRRAKEEGDGALNALVASAVAGDGVVLDPKDKKQRDAVDRVYLGQAMNWEKQGVPADQQTEASIVFAAKAGMVPEAMQAQIRGSLRAGTVAQKIMAADNLEKLRNANPQLLDDFSKTDIEMGSMISENARLGIPAAEAVRRADEAMRRPEPERQVLRQEYRAQIRTTAEPMGKNADYLKSNLNSFAERWLPGVSNPSVPTPMIAEFTALAESSYMRTGSLETAQKIALAEVQRTWGVSKVGGAERWMKNAPEKFYGRPDKSASENSEWMQEQLISDYKAGAIVDASADLDENLRVIPDPNERVDPSTGNPMYSVVLQNDGTYTPALGKDGTPLAWAPDWKTSAEGKKAVEADRKAMIEARISDGRFYVQKPRKDRTHSDEVPDDLFEVGNINLMTRPTVKNEDGSISTVRSIGISEDGVEVLIPTVSSDGKIMPDVQAVAAYHRTGKHLGKFKTVAAANAYATRLHNQQAEIYGGK